MKNKSSRPNDIIRVDVEHILQRNTGIKRVEYFYYNTY